MSTQLIEQLEIEIKAKTIELEALKKNLPPEPIQDYNFQKPDGATVSLSDLFGDADELLVIHNMGKSCKYCTMWADGFRGFSEIISDRMPWVLTSPDAPEVLKEFGEDRGWNFRSVSYRGTDFAYDLGYELRKDGKKDYWPGVSALIKKDGQIYRTGKDFFGPGDSYNAFWHFMKLFPKGNNNWQPKYKY